ncbi:MAG: nucleotidyltransferase domain-containing protein [Nanoarchaeota archaeon]|nr:nucleotidyltransferase domain-containing protein [Nanoarchaeota archaeon]
MKTIIKPAIYKILKLFYENRNSQLHLREIARRTKINESSITRHLNNMVKNKILKTIKDANLKKFCINLKYIPIIFPIFDEEKLENLPLLRRNAIKEYIKNLKKKPVILVVFGSTAKNTFRENSDLDLLEIINTKYDNEDVKKYVESQTSIRIQTFRLLEKDFKKELKLKKDNVVQAALKTGFPVFNKKYYYEVIYNE